ncbi:hypothetical protein Gotri_019199, partial [Gossypium trilobum]|nr:hypothetical protein [Gossypium trilobum]
MQATFREGSGHNLWSPDRFVGLDAEL